MLGALRAVPSESVLFITPCRLKRPEPFSGVLYCLARRNCSRAVVSLGATGPLQTASPRMLFYRQTAALEFYNGNDTLEKREGAQARGSGMRPSHP